MSLPQFSIRALPALLRTRAPVILEIGANDGRHSAEFLRVFPKAQVFCFEPDPRAIASWRKRMSGTSATLIETAIGSFNGTAEFYESRERVRPNDRREWSKSGSIRVPTGHLQRYPGVTFGEEAREVQIATLDQWALDNRIRHVDFIWADIQGAEGDLIAGGQAVLWKTRYLYTEYSNTELYDGQITLAEISKRLPTPFMLLAKYPHDALFINCAIRTSGAEPSFATRWWQFLRG